MDYFIEIDRDSVARDPRAGATTTDIQINVEGVLKPCRLDHEPRPRFMYAYVDKKIKCSHCNREFSWKKIELIYHGYHEFSFFECPLCFDDRYDRIKMETLPESELEQIEAMGPKQKRVVSANIFDEDVKRLLKKLRMQNEKV